MRLRYVPLSELERLERLDVTASDRAQIFADACRINALYMIKRGGSGHIGTSFSSIEIVSWLYLAELGPDDLYFSSKGHDSPALYAVLTGTGRLDFDLIHRFRRLGGLPGHPDVVKTPAVHTSTGSLGMGVSKAKGFLEADRLEGRERRVFVMTGDGELQEGQFWESLISAGNSRLASLAVLVDANALQSDTWVAKVSDLGDLEAKVEPFGWAIASCDGNDVASLDQALRELEGRAGGRPKLIVAETTKGAGVSFMQPDALPVHERSLYDYHSGSPGDDEYERGLSELRERLDRRLVEAGAEPIELEEAEPPEPPQPLAGGEKQNLVSAYGDALVKQAAEVDEIVVLDADLVKDCGLVPFRDRFPERFVECGIAEQDMVSRAGALALAGRRPFVHSFGCFLTTRANEQIFNNAAERTPVIYVGSLVGLVPGGPGHSHQAVRDIATMASIPGLTAIEPFCDRQLAEVVAWAANRADGPVYIRLVTPSWPLGFQPPALEPLQPGRGQLLRQGVEGTFVATGPVMLSQAWAAADRLTESGRSWGVLAMPWLNEIDGRALIDAVGEGPIVTLDNHYLTGGQGDAVLRALGAVGAPNRVLNLGVTTIPECGLNEEVLRFHELDGDSIAARVAEL